MPCYYCGSCHREKTLELSEQSGKNCRVLWNGKKMKNKVGKCGFIYMAHIFGTHVGTQEV